ncbi:MAG: HEPN domain-containing protein [Planctomycetia bacterium]|nr:HEPN domain-containing protein [Planctomycetia bacterium]
MNRAELQQLAADRLADAKALLVTKRWAGAYYLAGYAVECALKACIIRHLMASDQFPEKKFSEQCWTHNLSQLFTAAGLKIEFDAAQVADPELLANWGLVKDWSESTRYERKSPANAEQRYEAITDKKHGVLTWIKARW